MIWTKSHRPIVNRDAVDQVPRRKDLGGDEAASGGLGDLTHRSEFDKVPLPAVLVWLQTSSTLRRRTAGGTSTGWAYARAGVLEGWADDESSSRHMASARLTGLLHW